MDVPMDSDQVLLLLFMGVVAVLPWLVIAVESRTVRDWCARNRVQYTTRETRNQIISAGMAEIRVPGGCACANLAGVRR